MSSLFCPDCGMMRSRCICNKKNKPKIKHENGSQRVKSRHSTKRVDQISHEKPQKTLYSNFNKKRAEDLFITPERVNELRRLYPHIDTEIIKNFPFPNPRKGQLEIVQDIKNAIEYGYKYIVLEAGTGTGKSGIATTLARMHDSAYILTMTKQLQNQYVEEFQFEQVKGRGNFSCLTEDLMYNCDMGACQTTTNPKKFFCRFGISKNPTLDGVEAFKDSYGEPIFFASIDHCHYWEQKAAAINSDITLMNYDYAFLELNFVGHFGKRDIMILDEAHNIEDKLMKRLEVNLYNERLRKDINKVIPPEMKDLTNPEDWLLQIEAFRDSYDDINLKEMPKNKADRIRQTINRLNELLDNMEAEPKNWVVDYTESGVSFKPLKVHKYAQDRLFKHANTLVFMSATILSHDMFCKWLGINPKEAYFIKVDSPFSPEHRPIKLRLAGKMAKSRIKRTAPATLPILEEILAKHAGDKGLIHTHNYQCQNYLMSHLNSNRLMSHNSKNREQVLQHFESTVSPAVLVSPSMSEGVDLPYDKCRFQVIYKIPFPYLGDRQVDLRRKTDMRWYAYKTVMTLMQAYGRGMRAEDDECYTYILDSNINMLLDSPLYRSLLPEFFKEAIVK